MKSYKTRVEFYDVDSLGVVWHGNYAKFLEFARCAFLRELGYDYNEMKNDGFAYPVVKMDFKFIKPLFFGDEIEILVELLSIECFLKFKYTILKNGEKVCKASTSQACVDLRNHQSMIYAPQKLKKLAKEFL